MCESWRIAAKITGSRQFVCMGKHTLAPEGKIWEKRYKNRERLYLINVYGLCYNTKMNFWNALEKLVGRRFCRRKAEQKTAFAEGRS